MKPILSVLLIVFISACTSLKPIEMKPLELQNKIANSTIIKAGDEIKIFTTDNKELVFEITEISKSQITGEDIVVPITDIIALETREFSGGKTALLVGGMTALTYVAIVISTFSFLL